MDKDELLGYCRGEFEKLQGLAEALSPLCPPEMTDCGLTETAAIGAFLFSLYSGIERVLEQLLLFDSLRVGETQGRHPEILKKASELGIVPPDLHSVLAGYLAFREVFGQSYITELNCQKLCGLAREAKETVDRLEKEVLEYIETI